jgi:sulfatase maturation enzyme AslB (radical SAM superfamily)
MKTTIIPLTQLTKSLKKKEDHIKMFEQTDKSFTKFQIANTSEQFYYSNYDNAIYDINKVLKSHTSPKDQTWFEVIKETRNIKGKSSSPYWIRILLGHACNYSCSYCLQKDIGNPDERQKIETTDKFILDLEKLNWSSVEKVDLWGGEPFLYWNTMVPLMRHFDRHNLTWFISTNGSALQQKHVDFFASLKSTVEIGLSHDALAHERLRGPEVLIKKVEILKMMQSAPNIKFGINTVISDSNFDLFEINDFFYNYLTENNLDKSKFGLGFILGRNHDYENTHNSAMHVISDENLPKFKKILKTYIEKGIEQTLKKVDNKILNNSLLFGPTGVFDFAKSMRSQVLPTITTSCGVDDA